MSCFFLLLWGKKKVQQKQCKAGKVCFGSRPWETPQIRRGREGGRGWPLSTPVSRSKGRECLHSTLAFAASFSLGAAYGKVLHPFRVDLPTSSNLTWKIPQRCSQKCVSVACVTFVKLIVKIGFPVGKPRFLVFPLYPTQPCNTGVPRSNSSGHTGLLSPVQVVPYVTTIFGGLYAGKMVMLQGVVPLRARR